MIEWTWILNSPVNIVNSYIKFAFVTSKCYRSQECGPGLIVEDNDYRGSGQQAGIHLVRISWTGTGQMSAGHVD